MSTQVQPPESRPPVVAPDPALLRQPYRMRPMTMDDVPQTLEVERSAHEFPWTEGILRNCLQPGHCSWVWDEGDTIMGFGVLSVGAGESHLLNLCTHPQYRRRGIARKLLIQLLSLAVRHGAEVTFLEVRANNETALQLYYKMGFNEIGLRKGYYPAKKGREDALILARSF